MSTLGAPKMRRRLPPEHHPVWRLAQQALTLAALVFVAYHLGHGHAGWFDAGDAVGGTLIVKELIYWLKRSALNGQPKE